MKKRELVHMHALLDQVGRFIRAREDLEEGDLEAYKRLGVAPAAVYESKGAHEDAVTTLCEALADAVDDEASGETAETGETESADPTHASVRSD